MKLKDTREEYYFYSGKVSDIVRQLGLAGIAIVWLFRIESSGKAFIPKPLIPAAFLLLTSLALDLSQYAAGAAIWNRFNRQKEIELEEKLTKALSESKVYDPEEEDFTAPDNVNYWTKRLFWSKLVLMLLAYAYLITYLVVRIL